MNIQNIWSITAQTSNKSTRSVLVEAKDIQEACFQAEKRIRQESNDCIIVEVRKARFD